MSTGYLVGRNENHGFVQHCDVTKLVHVEMFVNVGYCTGCIEELHELYVGCFDEGIQGCEVSGKGNFKICKIKRAEINAIPYQLNQRLIGNSKSAKINLSF